MSHVLLISSPDQVGLIHEITGVLLGHNLNIVSNDEFVDPDANMFFMRTEFIGENQSKRLLDELRGVLPPSAKVEIAPPSPKNVVLLAGKEPHCLGDLLLRHCNAELKINIQAVISNHESLQRLVERFEIPFFHLPIPSSSDRAEFEGRLGGLVRSFRPDYLVLAKFMRILGGEFVADYPNRIINIHHSFLPAFVGAQPYRQAFQRGVKIIGATAHFVTADLDDGPIIAQSVLPVTHVHTPKSMAQEGREIEKLVLARALQLVVEDRVFVSGNKTIIFE